MTDEKKDPAQDKRLDQMESIVRRNDRRQEREEEKDAPKVEVKAEVAPEPVAEVAPEPEVIAEPIAPDLSVKIKRKVNGLEVEKSLEEWIAAGQKVEAADRYLADSAKAFKVTQEPEKSQAPAAQVEQDDLAIARAIQAGTEDEARAAVSKLRPQPQVTPEQLLPLVDQRLAALEALRQFETEFKDIVSDPNLRRLVADEDARLLQSNYQGSNLDRFREAGSSIRKWRDSFAGQVQSEKQQRKASVTVLPTAAARAAGKTEEPEQTTQDVIRGMAEARRGR